VLFGKIASVYFIRKKYLYFSVGNGRPREPRHCLCLLYQRAFVPYRILSLSGKFTQNDDCRIFQTSSLTGRAVFSVGFSRAETGRRVSYGDAVKHISLSRCASPRAHCRLIRQIKPPLSTHNCSVCARTVSVCVWSVCLCVVASAFIQYE